MENNNRSVSVFMNEFGPKFQSMYVVANWLLVLFLSFLPFLGRQMTIWAR